MSEIDRREVHCKQICIGLIIANILQTLFLVVASFSLLDNKNYTNSLKVYKDKLDSILIETDNNSFDYIEWLEANAKFPLELQGESKLRHDNWKAIQEKTDGDYNELTREK